jgi:hypothetical protein
VLAVPAGFTSIYAVGTDADGSLYGQGVDGQGATRPVVWSSPTAPASVLDAATGYNDVSMIGVGGHGVVVGSGHDAHDQFVALAHYP